MALAFFIAFLAGLWLLGLPFYWLFFTFPAMRRGVLEKWAWYQTQPFWPHGIFKVLFVALNAWELFPVKGTLVCTGVLIAFWLLPK